MRDLFSTLRKLTLALALGTVAGLMTLSPAAEAANVLERNFWLSGPRYDGAMRPCNEVLGTITQRSPKKRASSGIPPLRSLGFCQRP